MVHTLAILLIGALAFPLAQAPGAATLGKGTFLVSKQTLTDPNFEATVILLCYWAMVQDSPLRIHPGNGRRTRSTQ